jgi:HTH-type transcriptional regulator, sugar sensing transcriptional regulator
MRELHRLELEELGLSSAEAQVYLALLRSSGGLGASAVATMAGIQRTSIYPILDALLEKGMVERGAGYGSRFTAVAPKQALPSLITREKQELSNRERLAGELADKLESVTEPFDPTAEVEVIQVLRDPRLIAERFERLELEAERQIEVFNKPPVIGRIDNPAQNTAMRRGVRVRGIYEQTAINDSALEPYLSKWIAAGEEVRFYEGDLPHKLALFDRQIVLIPLVTPSGQGSALFIRHPQLALSLGMLFDSFWERSKPFPVGRAEGTKEVTKAAAAPRKLQLRSTGRSTNSQPGISGTKVPF